ncbi:hypothetical protein [Nocardioides montaniterrae]
MKQAEIPLGARLRLAHAVVQAVAERAGVDLLHVKGVAASPEWYPPHSGSDVDVVVRPSHIAALETGLTATGWRPIGAFEDSSAWAHAAAWWHDGWGCLDLHRAWPGLEVDAEAAYDALGRSSRIRSIAHRDCVVPGEAAEVLLLVLHEGRSGPVRPSTRHLRERWAAADPLLRAEVEALVRELGAEVGFAAGLGRLDEMRDHPDHALWVYYSSGDTNRWREWRARLVSARAHGALGSTLRRALRPATPAGAPDRPVVVVQAARAWHLVRDVLDRGRR